MIIYLKEGGASNDLINQIVMFITINVYAVFPYILTHYCNVYLDHMSVHVNNTGHNIGDS